MVNGKWFSTYDRDENFVTERTIVLVHIWNIKVHFMHIFALIITVFSYFSQSRTRILIT